MVNWPGTVVCHALLEPWTLLSLSVNRDLLVGAGSLQGLCSCYQTFVSSQKNEEDGCLGNSPPSENLITLKINHKNP